MRALIVALTLVLSCIATPVSASELDDAKAAGHLGERIDGYLEARPGAPAGAVALAEETNAARRAAYAEIAAKRGVPVEAVAQIAGKKVIGKTPPGQWIMDTSGWHQK